MIGRTLRAASCSQSGIEASSKLINAEWIFLQRAQIKAQAGLTTWTRSPGGQETLAQFAGAGKVNDEDGTAGKV